VRLLVLVASPVTAVICNVLRLIPIVWMYGHVSSRVADLFHDISSWCMLILAFLGLLAIVRLLRWAMVPVTPFTLARG
jgi:exosortase/archaeosortase family protein